MWGLAMQSFHQQLRWTLVRILSERSIRPAFRKAMLEGKIVTDVAANPPGTIEHANLILAAPTSGD